jgi:hypothetical protein
MNYKNLECVLDKLFGPFSNERELILKALQKDIELINKSSSIDYSNILEQFNKTFDKRSRIISKKVATRYNEILKHFTLDEIQSAMYNAKNDEFHKENNYKYCTLEYFSRIDQIDKWLNATKKENKKEFTLPSFNIKQ